MNENRMILVLAVLVIAGCTSADRSTVVPVTLRERTALVSITIGDEQVPVVLDSGDSGAIALTDAALRRAGAKLIDGTSMGMDIKGNILEAPRFKVPRLQVGSAVFSDVIADLDVHARTYPANQVGQQGFIGTALFESYQLLLDFPRRRMTLIGGADQAVKQNGCEGASVPFSPEWKGQPVTIVETDFGQLQLWWDTGMPVSVLSKRSVEERLGATMPRPADNKLQSTHLEIGDTNFGPWEFAVWEMALSPGFDGFIGYDFFEQHVVCMDFPGNRLRLPKSLSAPQG
jgi:hypothetical protein